MTPTQHNDIAGAIFSFAGFLTAHKEVIAVGSTASASPMVSRIQEWAEARGLSLESPNVMAWNEALAEPAPGDYDINLVRNEALAEPAPGDYDINLVRNEALAEPAPVQEPVCRGCGIPINDIHMSTCPTKKWPMYVTPADAAQPAPVQEKP